MKYISIFLLAFCLLSSCATKKEILYLQDADKYDNTVINYSTPTIQPNDILKITVGALEPGAVIPYNRSSGGLGANGNVSLMKLEGYIVTPDNTINFPELGEISTKDKTVFQLEKDIKMQLEEGGHVKNPTVNIRVLNAKVTILGEVKSPGTFDFTEQNITLLQALGYAGDLTINGMREDILIMRETDSIRQVSHIDLTSAELLKSPFYNLRPNDVIVVNPNGPKVKSAGFVGNVGTFISVFSILLSTILIITR